MNIFLLIEIFLVGSHPTLSEIFLIGSQPNAWSCLIFNVLFSPNWSRRRSTKPALLYAILRNLKILVLKRRCVLDSFIGTINRHRSSLNNFTPQPYSESFQSFTMPRCLALNLMSRGRLLHTAALLVFPIDDGQSSVQRESNPHLSGWVRRNCI